MRASLASSINAIYLIALFTRLLLLYSNVHKKIWLFGEAAYEAGEEAEAGWRGTLTSNLCLISHC